MTYVVLMLKGYLSNPIDCVKPAIATEPGKVYRKDMSPFFRDELLAPVLHFVSVGRGEKGLGVYMREARRSTSFKYTTWILAMQCSWTLMSIRMNHPFRVGKSLPARQEDSKLQIPVSKRNLSIFRGLKGAWKHIRTLEWKWKRDVTPVPSESLVNPISDRGRKGYNSAVECHLDVVEVISSSLIIPKPNGWLYFWERTPGEYEAHGYKLCLRMKDNSESALMNAGGMLNTCKSDGKWCFQWRTGDWKRLLIPRRLRSKRRNPPEEGLAHGPDSYGRQQWGIFRNGRKPDGSNGRVEVEGPRVVNFFSRRRSNDGIWGNKHRLTLCQQPRVCRWLFKSAVKSQGSTLDRRWKLPSWSTVGAEGISGGAVKCTKARGANGIRYPSSPSRKRWILGAVRIDPCSAVANALSIPPGETLPGLDMPRILLKERGAFGNADTGGAWLSSARATAGDKPEEGEDDVKSSCPLCPGRHTCYNGRDKGSRSREGELTPKTRPQFGLQAATRLHEAGIASNRRRYLNRKEGDAEGRASDWSEVGELMLVGYFGLTLLHTQNKKKGATSELNLEMEVFFHFSTVK
ncbi:UNVERIFIED_CONTAM: hypothetical protein Sindi_2003900 [Sesamum indicum]